MFVLNNAIVGRDEKDVKHLVEVSVGDAGCEGQATQRNAIFIVAVQTPDEHVAREKSLARHL